MRRGGFSLVEISIVLIVVSVMISGVLPYITESQKTNAANDTAERLEKIELAMLTFRAANGFIPCPSDIAAALNSAAFGTALASGCATATFTDTDNAAGGVPTKTLGLADEYGFDGWGRRMTYHVTRALTGSGYSSGTGALTVNDGAGNPRTAEAAYAVVSHGPNGHGAYTRGGTRFSFGSTNTNEQENCECNASATATTYDSILVQSMAMPNSNPLAAFDDVVRYQLKPSLDLLVGGGGTGGSCTGIAPSGWPDAIRCNVTSPNWGQRALYIQNAPYAPDGRYYYMEPADNGGSTRYVSFNADKSFAAAVGYTTHNCNQPISALEAAGQTFNFCGGSGGGWADVPLTDTANFDVSCMYRISTGAMKSYAVAVLEDYILFDVSTAAFKFGAVEKATKNQYHYRDDGNTAVTSGGPFAVTQIEKNCGGGGGSGGGGGTPVTTCTQVATNSVYATLTGNFVTLAATTASAAECQALCEAAGAKFCSRYSATGPGRCHSDDTGDRICTGTACGCGSGACYDRRWDCTTVIGGGDFGAFSAVTWGVTHTATSAGIVTAYATNTDTTSHCYVDGYVNGTVIARAGNREGYTSTRGSISFPVPNGATYRVVDVTSTCTAEAAYFTPLN